MSFPTAEVLLKTRREQEEDWTGTQLLAGRLPMSSAHSMNARKRVHAQKPYPSQAFAHESSKVGGKRKRETGKNQERKAAQQNKNTSEELKEGLAMHSSGEQTKWKFDHLVKKSINLEYIYNHFLWVC